MIKFRLLWWKKWRWLFDDFCLPGWNNEFGLDWFSWRNLFIILQAEIWLTWLIYKWWFIYWLYQIPLVSLDLNRERMIVRAWHRLLLINHLEWRLNWFWLLNIWWQLRDVNERWNSIFSFFWSIDDVVHILPNLKSFISLRILHNEVTPNFFTKEWLFHHHLRCLLRIFFHLQAYSIMARFTWGFKLNLWLKVASYRNIFSYWNIKNFYFFFIYFLQTRIFWYILSASVFEIPFFRNSCSSSHIEVLSKAFTHYNQVKCLPILLNSRQA